MSNERIEEDIFSVEGYIAVVTGGMGQLGRQFVKSLAERGAKVAIFARHAPDRASIKQVFAGLSERIIAVPVDITKKETIKQGLSIVMNTWGIPHVLINNAGLDTQPSAPPEVSGPFENFPDEVFREVVEVNLVGTFLCCQVIGAEMAKAGRGSIINIGSIYGMLSPVQDIYAYKEAKTGIPFVKPVAYSASKSGVYNLTRYLATYWAAKGVRVNTLTPSGVWRSTQDPEFQANYCAKMPMKRMAREDEFNGAIIFLASQASSYMTGSNLVIDGGWTAW
ncbi:3-oxoacyl-(Acyl-carrier-protein) reductase [uncultured spirochete]|jgi:NAD(P)-dependent dehydrogenase (short-subunit alcohol dehydrogenase family)|uniref:3-oxoacyl-(Acyl-carrier-protein) reductase n=1 Tax=uncultured spirochete TaxID=156406 RepID=A0A3P3XIN0_9SPIR|nr:SDR family oxidoreductase [Rectinema subterraneum]SLM12966.1 3-oxoacyl-(Acyl-carrier-protein) reductase [uncultured spirochete]